MITTAFVLLIGLLALSIPVGAVLGIIGLSLAELFSGMPLYRALGEIAWAANTNILLAAIPLFILLGEILLRSGIADGLYSAMAKWLSWLPGGLMHSNIGTCTAFAATSGSSVATAATIGTVALPLIERHRYNERLFLGSLAAGGTLGILIPPSINMIIYGWLTETSVPQLYIAGFIPGVILSSLFMLTILVACLFRKKWGGAKIETTWKERIEALPALLPPLGIFIVVIGSIYAGIATPTESAALGVVCALALAAAHGRLTFKMLHEAMEGTMRTTGMLVVVLWGAWFLNFILGTLGFLDAISNLMEVYGVTPFQTLMTVVAIYLVLGCFMDPLALMIITVPVITPVVVAAGYDPVWFGILVVILIETALITPPFGLNLFVVQGVRRRGSLNDVIIGVGPFVVTLLVMIVLIIAFPNLALWLPQTLR